MRRFIVILIVLTAHFCTLRGSETVYRTRTITPDVIKTLRMRYIDTRTGEPLAGDPQRPFLVISKGTAIDERGDQQNRVLEISFDELSHEVRQYTYSLLHLNADGTESSLNSAEYVSGFTTQDITQYEHSLNTSDSDRREDYL